MVADVVHTIFIDTTPSAGGQGQLTGIRVVGNRDGLRVAEAEVFCERYLSSVADLLGRPGEPFLYVDPEFPGVEWHYRLCHSDPSTCIARVALDFEDCRVRGDFVQYVTCSILLSRALEDPNLEAARRERLMSELRCRHA
jgi:hypothetical protein